MTASLPWWRTDDYAYNLAMPKDFDAASGPKGVALVKAWPSGITDPGWGLNPPKGSNEGFMPRYVRGEFDSRRVLYGFERGNWAFAFIMRSVQLVCIDIDGKNGGLEHAKRLGLMPETMAETSKSGDGYHLFYTNDEPWDSVKGFGELSDRIAIEQGVDVRAVGCVYHYQQQRWNDRTPVPLPAHLKELLLNRDQKVAAAHERIHKVLEGDDIVEVLMLHDELERQLAKPIPQGQRNNTLFAIGNQMREAEVENWVQKLEDRATQLGLDAGEIDKLVGNIQRYGA